MNAMTITGNWTLFYDWNSDGSYSKTALTVNPNGTFTDGESHSGKWAQIAGIFMFTFNGSDTTYTGNWTSRSITGVSTTFNGLNGSFYMLQAGVPTSFNAERVPDKKDSIGK